MATKLATSQKSTTKKTSKSKPTTTGTTTKKSTASKTATKKTKVKIKFDVGFENKLFIRGEGAGLSWDKGTLLKNVGSDEWTWETSKSFNTAQFKVLINDTHYEDGENHEIKQGSTKAFTPNFS